MVLPSLMNAHTKQAILIGVNHRIQYKPGFNSEWSSNIQAFEDHLVKLANALGADWIAEEFNDELLKKNLATASTAKDAAKRANCEHIFCEPNMAERAKCGSSCEQREQEWLRRIIESGSDRLLMVCGHNHVESFSRLLKSAGYKVLIDSHRNWGNNWMNCD
jgi:hypothetical protein